VREFFDGYMHAFSRGFRDQALKSSRTRVVNLWQSSELDRYTVCDRMLDVRDTTKRSTGAVTTGGGGQKPLLPDWFAVLDERVTSRG